MAHTDILTQAGAVAGAAGWVALRTALADWRAAYERLDALCAVEPGDPTATAAAVRELHVAAQQVRACWGLCPVGGMPGASSGG